MGKAKNILRWLLLIFCIIFGLLYLNGAAASWWVSWGPPTDYPKAWEQNALIKLSYSLLLLFTGPMIFVGLNNNYNIKESKYKFIWLVVIIVSLSYPNVREFILKNKCIDSNGQWSEKHFVCNHS